MILSDVDILMAVENGDLVIEPFDHRLLKRNSYLVRLHDEYRRVTLGGRIIDSAKADDYHLLEGCLERGGSVLLEPESFVLGCTFEKIGVAGGIVGLLSGISNIARLGVMLHATSNLINAGFGAGIPSRVVFEMATMGGMRVRLHAGTPVCHLVFARVQTPTSLAMPSQRTGQDGPEPSNLLAQFGHFFTDRSLSPGQSMGSAGPSSNTARW